MGSIQVSFLEHFRIPGSPWGLFKLRKLGIVQWKYQRLSRPGIPHPGSTGSAGFWWRKNSSPGWRKTPMPSFAPSTSHHRILCYFYRWYVENIHHSQSVVKMAVFHPQSIEITGLELPLLSANEVGWSSKRPAKFELTSYTWGWAIYQRTM